jgi:hypothetical protein
MLPDDRNSDCNYPLRKHICRERESIFTPIEGTHYKEPSAEKKIIFAVEDSRLVGRDVAFERVTTGVSKNVSAIILALLNSEGEGTSFLSTVANHSRNDRCRIPERFSSATPQ